ncbi:MAG: hypothetical protein JNJ41_16365 [Bacteroidia bacterium]|nr:hypothetical protein [Bacteroidia bacterium]
MAAETQYTANTGMANIATANANLDGTGTLGTVLTAASNGTLIKSITVKSLVTTTQGMIRLFIFDGTNTRLIKEIPVEANTKSSVNPAVQYKWNCDIKLKSGQVLKASTEKAESFNIIAEGLDWAYYGGAVRPESTNFTANTGTGLVSTANSNLDGTGTVVTVLTTGPSASGWKGCRIESLTIKGIVTTTAGMIRLYIYDGTNTRIFKEVMIPAITKSATQAAFECKVDVEGFQLKPDYLIKASTQNAESFHITVEGNDWKYPA